ncbi:MAG: hypothetical protein KDC54_06920, partial [Lewinella sp.]|nr:hypothetical protein [Lewinella sp.]
LNVGPELEIPYEMGKNNTAISTGSGELMLYFNGRQVQNFNHELVENGDSMYLGELDLGYDVPQNAILLPIPEHPDSILIMNTHAIWSDVYATVTGGSLYYSIVDLTRNNGQGKVVTKNVLLEEDHPEFGKLTAVRHANGRDWWVIWPYWNSNRFMRFLLSPEGLQRLDDQIIGNPVHSGLGQAQYTPDGNKIVLYNGVSFNEGAYIDIYNVDRCAGLLSNQITFNIPVSGAAVGSAISSNSRYLYVTSTLYIFQYDLWAGDVAETKDTVAVYDGFYDPWLPASFFMGQLARDGKIYISSPNSVMSLTVIEHPDRGGDSCNVNQHAVQLPVLVAFGIPTFPNHRLGPIDGSPCDTLGIDNIPLANFRSDQDTSDHLQFYFQDLSAYEPQTWHWDFGDNTTSSDTSPIHLFPVDGIYEVCLTVANGNGMHKTCDSLTIGIIDDVQAPIEEIAIKLFPNPVQDHLTIVMNDYYPRQAEVIFYAATGQIVHRQSLWHGWNNVEHITWPGGIYFYEIWDQGRRLGQGKVVK